MTLIKKRHDFEKIIQYIESGFLISPEDEKPQNQHMTYNIILLIKTYSFNQHYISYNINYKYYFMKEDIPEKSVERLHLKYDEYKATAEEPILTFKEFCSKMQYLETLVEEIDYYKKEKSKLESEIEVLKKELNFDSKITDVEVDKLIMDFNNFYDEVIDSSLRYDEKFKKLELYYLNVVRNIDNEFKLLHSIQNRINEELKTDGVNSLLIEIHEYIKHFLFLDGSSPKLKK